MPLEFAFRLSLYLTLGFACACLGYAELAFLPELSVLAGLVALLLVGAFFAEGRWELSIPAANVLGVIIFALAGIWVGSQLMRPGSLLETLPFPSGVLPYLGPVLMILIPAKLLRHKDTGDYWGLLGVGLAAVALGCALAFDVLFGLLLTGFLICGSWNLTLFYLYRETLGSATRRTPTRWQMLTPAVRWTLVAGLLGWGFFLATPRSEAPPWELSLKQGRLETGYPDERSNGIDLNRTGTLSINREIVLVIQAQDRFNHPKRNLDQNLRLRGSVLNTYHQGRWQYLVQRQRSEDREGRPTFLFADRKYRQIARQTDAKLPNLGVDSFYLTFKPHAKLGSSVFLAEPVWGGPGLDAPVVSLTEDDHQLGWYTFDDGTLMPVLDASQPGRLRYKQACKPAHLVRHSPPVDVDPFVREGLAQDPKLPELRRWVDEQLKRLVANKQLTAPALDRNEIGHIKPEHHEAVARALSEYLRSGQDFKYSLRLERQDRTLDPTEDFVLNVRKGTCERFASVLALMLRTQHIPCQVVMGFRGCEQRGDGTYDVRQSNAHAWIEVLISQPAKKDPLPPFAGRAITWHWLQLDPTPSAEATTDSTWMGSEWLTTMNSRFQSWFQQFVVGYNADERQKTGQVLFDQLQQTGRNLRDYFRPNSDPMPVILTAVGLVVLLSALSVRRWGKLLWRWCFPRTAQLEQITSPVAFQAKLLTLLARFGHLQPPGTTAREFAHTVAQDWPQHPHLASVASVPVQVVERYYAVRFGGQTLTDTDQQQTQAQLDQLHAALQTAQGAVP
jgi:transglutaminase-like putative cysteine protease